jgi:hypothetical protein
MATMISAAYSPDVLVTGAIFKTESIILSTGNLVRGTVLGILDMTVPSTGTADGGNTGNGTCTAVNRKRHMRAGVYTALATAATKFNIKNTLGEVMGEATAGTQYTDREITLLITAGGTAFIAGDKFTITITVGNMECVIVNSLGTNDGRRLPYCVLAEDCDASSAKKDTVGYLAGNFNAAKLVFGGSDTIETHRADLRDLGIFTEETAA